LISSAKACAASHDSSSSSLNLSGYAACSTSNISSSLSGLVIPHPPHAPDLPSTCPASCAGGGSVRTLAPLHLTASGTTSAASRHHRALPRASRGHSRPVHLIPS